MNAPLRLSRNATCRWTAARTAATRAAAAAAVAAAILATACTSGPDFHRPASPDAARYTAPGEAPDAAVQTGSPSQEIVIGASISGNWWSLFRSDALDSIVKQALDGNRTIAAAAASLEQASELATAATGVRYPQLAMTAGIGGQKYGAQFLGPLPAPPAFSYFSIGPSVSYSLDVAGGIARSIERQGALAEYQRHQTEAAYLTVTGNAVMLSLQAASLQTQLATAEKILQQDQENVKLVQVAFDAGSVARVDVLSAQSQLASDATLLPGLRQQLSVARHALAIATGRLPSDVSLPMLDLDALELPLRIPVSVPSELAHRRPDVLAAESQLHVATAEVGIASANLYPRIDLTGTLGLQSTNARNLFDGSSGVWSAISALTAPIFDGGRLRAEKRASIAALRVSAANYEQTVLTAFGQVADALDALEHDRQELDAQAHAQESALASYELTQRSYNEGNVGILQVLDSSRLSQQAQLGYARARAQRYIDTAQLLLALGGAESEGATL